VYTLPFNERRRLHDRAYRAQQRDQSEVAGLVVVEEDAKLTLMYLPNHSLDPCRYTLLWREVLEASRVVRREGGRVLGTFHSHPITEARPSEGDIARGFFHRHELIYDVCGREVRLWRLAKRRTTDPPKEVAIVVEPRPRRPSEQHRVRRPPPRRQRRGQSRGGERS
jgi:proteasome lid subunit RPN8/RPN11